jgi:hypothetical protein
VTDVNRRIETLQSIRFNADTSKMEHLRVISRTSIGHDICPMQTIIGQIGDGYRGIAHLNFNDVFAANRHHNENYMIFVLLTKSTEKCRFLVSRLVLDNEKIWM